VKPAALTVNLSDHDMPTFNSCSVVDVLSVHVVFDIMAVQPSNWLSGTINLLTLYMYIVVIMLI